MGANLLQVKDKVQRFLSEQVSHIEIGSSGALTFRQGSTRVFINVTEHGDKATIINVAAPVLRGLKPSVELYKYVAMHGGDYIFGHLSLLELDDGLAIHLSHNLLGDYLDADELHWATGAIAVTADELDNELQNQFGGHLFHED